MCAAASAHPCDVCSPKKVTLLLIFCTYCNIYTIQLQKLWLGGSAERVLCVYKPFFASSCVFRNPNGPNPTRRSQPLSVCKMNQYSVLLFKFAEVLTEAEGHRRSSGVGVLPLPAFAAATASCCLLLLNGDRQRHASVDEKQPVSSRLHLRTLIPLDLKFPPDVLKFTWLLLPRTWSRPCRPKRKANSILTRLTTKLYQRYVAMKI